MESTRALRHRFGTGTTRKAVDRVPNGQTVNGLTRTLNALDVS